MNKKYYCITLLFSSFAFSQVGINTDNPSATLDVKSIVDITKADGVIPPILTGAQLKAKENAYTTLQTGAIVYVSEPLNPIDPNEIKTNITSIGYYYFDGAKWVKLGGDTNTNIYTDNGTLLSNRVVNLGNKSLTFTGTSANGVLIERTNVSNSSPAYLSLRKNNAPNFEINGAVVSGQVIGALTFGGNTGNGYEGDALTSNSGIVATSSENFTSENQGSYLDFNTVPTGSKTRNRSMRIAGNGNVGIGTGLIDPTEKLEVNGKVKIKNTDELTSSTVQPLFVDENGVVGKSAVSSISPLTATNGLNLNSSIVKLGGILTEPTTLTIDNQANSLIINNSNVIEDTSNQAALIVNNGKTINNIPNAALVQFKTLPYTDTLPTTYNDGQSRAIPLYIDEDGRLVRQQTVIDQDSRNNSSPGNNSSYTVNKKFDLTNNQETVIFSSINQGTIVNFDFFTNYAYGNSQSSIIYGEISFTKKQGFKLVDWQSSGNYSTTIPNIVYDMSVIDRESVISKFTFDYAMGTISGNLEIGFDSVNESIYVKPINVSSGASSIAITVINGLKIR